MFSLEKAQEDIIDVHKYLIGGSKEDEGTLVSFSVVTYERMRSNGHKLEYRKFHLKIRIFFFSFFFLLCGEALEQVAWRSRRPSVLGDIQTQPVLISLL